MPTFALKGICLSMLLFQSLTDRTDWLEEVELIISAKERAAYSELQNDEERAAFVKDFWRRRDPDPSTERNEAREEHCRRLEYVEKRFRQAGLRGAETDRGRVYVIHGEPDQRLPFASGTLRLPWSTQSGSGEVPVDFPESEIWTYRNIQTLNGTKGRVEILFVRGGDPTMLGNPRSFFPSMASPSELPGAPGTIQIPFPGGAGRRKGRRGRRGRSSFLESGRLLPQRPFPRIVVDFDGWRSEEEPDRSPSPRKEGNGLDPA